MKFEIGDKVRITADYHHEEMHRRLGTVVGYGSGIGGAFIVVDVPGYEHKATGTKWPFTRNELEKVES